MGKDEKKLLSKRRIIDSALEEFGSKSYAEASINSICKIGNISKGIVYYYFKDKDELYLICVRESIDKLIEFIHDENYKFCNIKQDIKRYLDLRNQFFNENPSYGNIFFNAVLQPPKHLVQQIKEMKNDLDMLNINYYQQALESIDLKEGVSREDAIEYFMILQETFNIYFQNRAYGGSGLGSLMEEHETTLIKTLKMMLYGIVKETTEQ